MEQSLALIFLNSSQQAMGTNCIKGLNTDQVFVLMYAGRHESKIESVKKNRIFFFQTTLVEKEKKCNHRVNNGNFSYMFV